MEAAEEWQIAWEQQASAVQPTRGSALSMLRKLYVNPIGWGLPVLQPAQPVPLSITLSAPEVQLCMRLAQQPDTGNWGRLQDSDILLETTHMQVWYR